MKSVVRKMSADTTTQNEDPNECRHNEEVTRHGMSYGDSNWQLSGEALDALEESLKQQYVGLLKEHKDFEEMIGKVTAFTEAQSDFVLRDIEAMKKEINAINEEIKEEIDARDQASSELRSVEQAFTDVNRKYERAMRGLENEKATEDGLKDNEEKLFLVMQHLDEQKEDIMKAGHERVEKYYQLITAKEDELIKDKSTTTALVRRNEMRLESLENELQQKKKENAMLSQLSDDLIGSKAAVGQGRRRNK